MESGTEKNKEKNDFAVFFFRKIIIVMGKCPVSGPDRNNLSKLKKGKMNMKKKLSLLIAAAGAAVLFAGCSTVQCAGSKELNGQAITASGTSVAHVSGYASGLYLLSIPLIVGSAETPDSTAFGEDSVNVTAVTKMVTKKSKDLKANRTVDLVSMTGSTNIPIPIPFLFYWKTATVSGNAVK